MKALRNRRLVVGLAALALVGTIGAVGALSPRGNRGMSAASSQQKLGAEVRRDSGAAFDQPHIHRRLGPGIQTRLGKQRHRPAQRMHRISHAVIAPAMSAGTIDGDVETPAGQGLGGDVIGVGPVQNQKCLDAASGAGLTRQVAHATEVAFALLADIGDEYDAAEQFVESRGYLNDAREGQQTCQASAVVGDAGAAQIAVRAHGNIFAAARGEHGIEVRGEGDVGSLTILDWMGDDVAGAIHAGNATQGAELGEHPFGAFLLEKGRGWDAAKLQVLLVDPLFFAGEPLKGVADRGGVGALGKEFRDGWRGGGRGGEFDWSCQVSV